MLDLIKTGRKIAFLRKERGLTGEGLAEMLRVSPQAVSKWENGRSLPETAILPQLARALNASVDFLLSENPLQILSARFGDGIISYDVANRLNRLTDNDGLSIEATAAALACPAENNSPKFLIIKYQIDRDIYYQYVREGKSLIISPDNKITQDDGREVVKSINPDESTRKNIFTDREISFYTEAEIVAAEYGTSKYGYDVMDKIAHYKPFNWNGLRADHETFPSHPANDETEYLSLVYINRNGIFLAACAEGESLEYSGDRSEINRKINAAECFIKNVPALPEFGGGWECSWAAALTAALKSMGHKTDYERVMGVSGACYRLAFCSPWDYSSVDGLVAYDYATPGFKAFGYKTEMFSHIEKQDRAAHRERIMKEIRGNMPVLGINLRVAPEWGVICGYRNDGEVLYCRTKFDAPTINNDPEFMRDRPEFKCEFLGPDDYMKMDNWPFLISHFAGKDAPPTDAENLINSLKIFIDCSKTEAREGYALGFNAYETWIRDLLDEGWYEKNDDEQFARRFSVNQFLTLALYDARRAAFAYLNESVSLLPGKEDEMRRVAEIFKSIFDNAERIHKFLDSGEELSGERARGFWKTEMRREQAAILNDMLSSEREAVEIAEGII